MNAHDLFRPRKDRESRTDPGDLSMDRLTLLAVYRAMFTARQIDQAEQGLTNRGEAFFHISGAGHEATAALAPHLTPADWLHCHYRDKALLVARGLPIEAFFDNLLCKHGSSSRGRALARDRCEKCGLARTRLGSGGALREHGVHATPAPRRPRRAGPRRRRTRRRAGEEGGARARRPAGTPVQRPPC